MSLAKKTGRALDEEISDKYFRKLPGQLGKEIELGRQKLEKSPRLGIGPRIVYTYMTVREKCTQTEIQRTLKKQDSGFCKKVMYTPQQYRESRERRKKYKSLAKNQKHPRRNRKSQKRF